jgi:acetoin utilization deacetylase AcuC-like enzyme
MHGWPVKRRDFFSTVTGMIAAAAAPVAARRSNYPGNSGMGTQTGYVYDERYLLHQHNPEVPQRLLSIQQMMNESGLIDEVVSVDAIEDPVPHIRRIHTEQHIERIGGLSVTGEVAALAAAGVCGAVKAVGEGKVRNCFCAIRPPGHHAHNIVGFFCMGM